MPCFLSHDYLTYQGNVRRSVRWAEKETEDLWNSWALDQDWLLYKEFITDTQPRPHF